MDNRSMDATPSMDSSNDHEFGVQAEGPDKGLNLDTEHPGSLNAPGSFKADYKYYHQDVNDSTGVCDSVEDQEQSTDSDGSAMSAKDKRQINKDLKSLSEHLVTKHELSDDDDLSLKPNKRTSLYQQLGHHPWSNDDKHKISSNTPRLHKNDLFEDSDFDCKDVYHEPYKSIHKAVPHTVNKSSYHDANAKKGGNSWSLARGHQYHRSTTADKAKVKKYDEEIWGHRNRQHESYLNNNRATSTLPAHTGFNNHKSSDGYPYNTSSSHGFARPKTFEFAGLGTATRSFMNNRAKEIKKTNISHARRRRAADEVTVLGLEFDTANLEGRLLASDREIAKLTQQLRDARKDNDLLLQEYTALIGKKDKAQAKYKDSVRDYDSAEYPHDN